MGPIFRSAHPNYFYAVYNRSNFIPCKTNNIFTHEYSIDIPEVSGYLLEF